MAKKDVRFNSISMLCSMYNQDMLDVEAVKERLDYDNFFIYEKEVPKFLEANPALDKEKFIAFAELTGCIRVPGTSKGGSTGAIRKLETPEFATAKGVSEENLPLYLEQIKIVRGAIKVLNEICTLGKVSFAIPLMKPKAPKETVPSADAIAPESTGEDVTAGGSAVGEELPQ